MVDVLEIYFSQCQNQMPRNKVPIQHRISSKLAWQNKEKLFELIYYELANFLYK